MIRFCHCEEAPEGQATWQSHVFKQTICSQVSEIATRPTDARNDTKYYFGKINSLVNVTDFDELTSTANDNAGTFTP